MIILMADAHSSPQQQNWSELLLEAALPLPIEPLRRVAWLEHVCRTAYTGEFPRDATQEAAWCTLAALWLDGGGSADDEDDALTAERRILDALAFAAVRTTALLAYLQAADAATGECRAPSAARVLATLHPAEELLRAAAEGARDSAALGAAVHAAGPVACLACGAKWAAYRRAAGHAPVLLAAASAPALSVRVLTTIDDPTQTSAEWLAWDDSGFVRIARLPGPALREGSQWQLTAGWQGAVGPSQIVPDHLVSKGGVPLSGSAGRTVAELNWLWAAVDAARSA